MEIVNRKSEEVNQARSGPDPPTAAANRPPKPAPLPVNNAAIPGALKALRRWVCWSWQWDPEKDGGKGGWDKPPCQVNEHPAKTNDPSTWTDYETSLAAHRAGRFDGIGIVLGDLGDGRILTGLDLDDVRDPDTGELYPWAAYAVARLNSYTDVSPSQEGVKGLGYGRLPKGRRQDQERGVEMYDGGRYFTVTGHRLDGTPADVMERATVLAELHAELLGSDSKLSHGSSLSDRDLALAALSGLSPSRAVGYWDWLGIGMVLHSVDQGEDMLLAWDQWSRACPEKYTEAACTAKWRSFKGKGLGIGSLIRWARLDGWTGPSTSVNRAPPVSNGQHRDTPPGAQKPVKHPDKWSTDEIAEFPIEWLVAYGVPLKTVKKYGKVRGVYFIVLNDDTEVEIGNSAAMLTPRTVQMAIADACGGIVIKELRRHTWAPVGQALLRMAQIIDTGTDPKDELRSWIGRYVRRLSQPRDDKTPQQWLVEKLNDGQPMRSEDGTVYVRLAEFRSWVSHNEHIPLTAQHLATRLRQAGWSEKQPAYRPTKEDGSKGEPVKVRAWVSPKGWWRDDYR
jgi:hypothetical protein